MAIAEEWKAVGGLATFISTCDSELLRDRFSEKGFAVITIGRADSDLVNPETADQMLERYSSCWVILDGYHFDSNYQQSLKKIGYRLMVIDDMAHLAHYYADVLLNQNVHAHQLAYGVEPHTHFLLGPRYALLRSEFKPWLHWKRHVPEVAKKVLVTIGGGDAGNATCQVIEALNRVSISDLDVRIVVGPVNPNIEKIKKAVLYARYPARIIQEAANMSDLMAWADVAVSASGSTCFELAFMGLPALLFVVGENQKDIAETMATMGLGINLGWNNRLSTYQIANALGELMNDFSFRLEMNRRGRDVVDGIGANRVVEFLRLQSRSEMKSYRCQQGALEF